MARLFSSGFELNSLTAAVEFDAAVGGTISSTTLRGGGFAGRVSSLVSATNQRFRSQFKSVAANGPFYFRFYYQVATLPSAENTIAVVNNSTSPNLSLAAYITIDNTGALRLYDNVGAIGSASSALSLNTWYRIEMLVDRTNSPSATQVVRARIDGVEFAGSATRTIGNTMLQFQVGGNLKSEAQTVGDWFFDDLAVNDTTGSFQNSYPGPGQIMHLHPNSAGDANSFAVQVGGTAGSANNYTRVNEVPPNDATSYNGSAVLSQEDLFNVENSGIDPTSIVNLVAVGARFADLVGTDATAAFKLEVMKTTGGTKSQSASIIPNSTTWKTNTTATPFLYPLTTYQDPDSAAWTQSTLDTMQIGYTLSAANVQTVAVSNVWALVEFTPATASPTNNNLSLLNVGT